MKEGNHYCILTVYEISVIDQCSSNPCGENGECFEGFFTNFTCECDPGFSGELCDEGIKFNDTHALI